MSSDEEAYERVDLYPAEEVSEDWEATPTLDTLPTVHAAIYNPNLTVDEVEAVVTAHPLCLESVEPQFGYTPLHCATKRCSMPLINMLVHHGAIVDTRAARGETPLMLASETGNLYVVHRLCECGADLSLVDSHGQSALHYAAKAGAVHILHYLSERGGLNFRATDNQGNTPLHLAASNHKLEAVGYLIRHKRCDLRASNKDGLTAVHYAAKHGSVEMCWILLSKTLGRKRDPLKQREKNGLTPLDIAKRGQQEDHRLLAKRLEKWSNSPDYMRLVPWVWWVLFSLLGGVTLLLALVAFTHIHQPVGLVVALTIAVLGFFLPLTLHRIPHPVGWPNPLLLGALVVGVALTCLLYLLRIFFVLWPDYALSFIILTASSITAQLLYFKLRWSDPGIDTVGKLGKDGRPLSIVDVARQANSDLEGITHLKDSDSSQVFCAKCEIVISEFTKHCKLCDSCCRGFDHHCMWLTRCVGYNSHRYFVVFMMCLVLDSFLFIYHSLSMMGKVGGDDSFWGMLSVGFTDQTAVMMLALCNCVAMVFAAMNTGQQLLQISRLETTYFDSEGRGGAYRKKRYGPGYSVITRVRLVILFFTNYPLWYSRSSLTKQTLTV
ncbi:uncharacterized protein LOC135341468 [Halichondria panicea]|uniref:uncharacterized protein LOC135341468 n=1 Tax=Halichondria panicea TaxID=6063 RepID=UPI00312B9A02